MDSLVWRRQIIKPEECLYCLEKETVHHLMFSCIVARNIWSVVSEFFAVSIGDSYKSVARLWVANSKNSALISICAAVMWNLWKLRNDMILTVFLGLTLHRCGGESSTPYRAGGSSSGSKHCPRWTHSARGY